MHPMWFVNYYIKTEFIDYNGCGFSSLLKKKKKDKCNDAIGQLRWWVFAFSSSCTKNYLKIIRATYYYSIEKENNNALV